MESNITILLPTFSKINFAIPKFFIRKISACVNYIFLMLKVTNIYWDKINSCYFFNVWTWKKVEIYTKKGEGVIQYNNVTQKS